MIEDAWWGSLRASQRRVLRLARALLRGAFFDLARRFTPTVALEEDSLRVLLRTDDMLPGRIVFARGIPERAPLARACARLGRLDLSDRQFVDVGANVGTATLAALRWQGFATASCFEPLSSNVQLLRQNLAVNGLQDRARIFELAVSDCPGSVPFEVAPQASGDGRVRSLPPAPGRFSEDRRPVIEVPATTLDRCVAEGTIAPASVGLLWIDVQGHEAHVLRGARRLLETGIPVVLELWPYGLKRAGGLEPLLEVARVCYRQAVDLRDGTELPTSELPGLVSRLQGIDFADVLLCR